MSKQGHLHPNEESGKRFYMDFHDQGSIIMLNMLRFNKVADYTGLENIKPHSPISGEQAYQLYMKETLPFIQEAGSELLFYGKSNHFLIGPEAEKWDLVLLVKHPSVAAFMAFAQNEGYLKIAGHRTAALEDSRLLPITELEI